MRRDRPAAEEVVMAEAPRGDREIEGFDVIRSSRRWSEHAMTAVEIG
jgi:hypothetical protein